MKGNRRLIGKASDEGQEYTSASSIADAFMADISEYPRYFRRSFIGQKLDLKHEREWALLSDVLYVLQKRGLIRFSTDNNSWENLNYGQ